MTTLLICSVVLNVLLFGIHILRLCGDLRLCRELGEIKKKAGKLEEERMLLRIRRGLFERKKLRALAEKSRITGIPIDDWLDRLEDENRKLDEEARRLFEEKRK